MLQQQPLKMTGNYLFSVLEITCEATMVSSSRKKNQNYLPDKYQISNFKNKTVTLFQNHFFPKKQEKAAALLKTTVMKGHDANTPARLVKRVVAKAWLCRDHRESTETTAGLLFNTEQEMRTVTDPHSCPRAFHKAEASYVASTSTVIITVGSVISVDRKQGHWLL